MHRRLIICCFFSFKLLISTAQNITSDSINVYSLPAIKVKSRFFSKDNQSIPEILGTNIYASKKSNVLVPEKIIGNVVNNTVRQITSKVPGIHIWENDGSGIQIGMATRGLSPNRSWDFNIRQNGYDISADAYGYPEAYYHPPLSGVQRMEIVRGHGALQYGPQLGGMVNYVLKDGSNLMKRWESELVIGGGSNGLVNFYAGSGVQWGTGYMYVFYDHRQGDGWRENNRFITDAGFITLTQKLSTNSKITAELVVSKVKSQQPGGLTDSLFYIDARKSVRSRNWMLIHWITPAVQFQYSKTERFVWNTKVSGVFGNRGSVGMMSDLLMKDEIQISTKQYLPRQVQIDGYQNIMAETRMLYKIPAQTQKHTLTAGVRYYQGNTHRQSNGKGTTGSDADLSVLDQYPSDVDFGYTNFAVFGEAMFKWHPRFSVIPGIRLEWLGGRANGRNSLTADGKEILFEPQKRIRRFVLSGVGMEYKLASTATLYANITGAYRPVLFSQLQVLPTTDSLDINLTDSRGYNADIGYKGQWRDQLNWDFSFFFLSYQNRIGQITDQGTGKRLMTNLGSSISRGVEAFIEWNLIKKTINKYKPSLSCYATYSFTDAHYKQNYLATSVKGNKVENAPQHILRTGVSFVYASALCSFQYNYVHGTYSDANNTDLPSANGQTGYIPTYRIWDMTLQYEFSNRMQIRSGVNNLMDVRYFTRRSGGYPGPGILPGDGRSCFLTMMVKFN